MSSTDKHTQTEQLLSDTASGSTVKLTKINSGRCFSGRLASLGIFNGTVIKVISNNFLGPMIVAVEGSRFAIGRGEASKILVVAI